MQKLAPPCRYACPAGIDVQGYVGLIAEGRFNDALDLIREDNPFPSVCGRVCMHPCEAECQRGKIDTPVAINALKMFAAKRGLDTAEDGPVPFPIVKEEKVAVVGSGPAGLSAAYFLVRKGYAVTVFEASSQAGGKLRTAIPEYRLPRKELDFDIQYLKDVGVDLKTNVKVGRDLTLNDLSEEGYQAVFIATGAHKCRTLNLPGEDLQGVCYALDFLRDVNLGNPVDMGSEVAVIGGGNEAIEAARVALRLGSRVQMFSILPRKEVPANNEDLKQGEMEGIISHFSVTPTQILEESGHVHGVEFSKMALEAPDELGRKMPAAISGSEFTMAFDTVIIAIGEQPEAIDLVEGLDISKWGTIKTNPDTLQTTIPHVFAGGDAVSGTSSVVEAICNGKKVAASIDAYLRAETFETDGMMRQSLDLPKAVTNEAGRHVMPLLPLEKRAGNFSPVELGYSEEMAIDEASRCLKCGYFDNLLYREVIGKGLCTACGTCIGICPEKAIVMNGVIPELTGQCISCGSCYEACPGKEIHMDRLDLKVSGRPRKENENRIGIHLNCYAANAVDQSIRGNAGSGGVVTSLLLCAFGKDLIDGAIVTTMSPDDPLRPMPFIATGPEDVIRSQKTKYMLVPGGLTSVLNEAVNERGLKRLAVVGSPCHIHAVRKLQHSANPYLKTTFGEKITYAIGHHCAFNFFPEGTHTIVQALGVPLEEVSEVGWRDTSAAPFPGQFCVTTKSGEKFYMPLLNEYVILGGIYDHPRCRICYDWANELADVSSGDEVDEFGFHKEGAQRSHSVVRTEMGEALFTTAVEEGYLEAEEVSEEGVARNLGFIIKKVGNIPRIEERRTLGLPLPEFGNYPFM